MGWVHLGSQQEKTHSRAGGDDAHLDKWSRGGEHDRGREHGKHGTGCIRTELSRHAPNRLRDHGDGDDFQSVQETAGDSILIGHHPLAEAEQEQRRG